LSQGRLNIGGTMDIQGKHNQEQAEAAVAEACEILSAHSQHYVVYVRVAPYTYARQISGRTHTERIALAHGVAGDLSQFVFNVAQIATEAVDIEGPDFK
jgi:hypothetical protein